MNEKDSMNENNVLNQENAKELGKILQNANKNDKNVNYKNLYQSIGTRVSKLREINENYEKKIIDQQQELNSLDSKIEEKEKLLEEIRIHKANLQRGFEDSQLNKLAEDHEYYRFFNKEKIAFSTKESEEYFENLYAKLSKNNEFSMKINSNHIQNDPGLRKIYLEKERELSELQNKLNSIVKKTDIVKKDIDALRLENHKNSTNLKELLEKKKIQTAEMDRISEEANRYLKEKGNINADLVKINEEIDKNKLDYENKLKELNKMIDNTKKIKEFHETLAIEKFSKTTNQFKKNNLTSEGEKKTVNIIEQESQQLEEIKNQLSKKKKVTAYLNLNKLVLLKKQQQLKEVIKKVRNQTGIENLDKLSEYLELSSKTNELFKNDLKNLNKQKDAIEANISKMKIEIENMQEKVNDTTSKKFEYINNLKLELEKEEKNREIYNKKLYTLNRMIDIITKGFKEVCVKLNLAEELNKNDLDTSEGVLTRCMDLLEGKIVEIIQLNQDPLRENNLGNILNNDSNNENKLQIMEKALGNMFLEDSIKNIYEKGSNFTLSVNEIKSTAKELVDSYMKKYEKIGMN